MKNKVQLITYADRLGDGTLSSMTDILRTRFDGVYDGVHTCRSSLRSMVRMQASTRSTIPKSTNVSAAGTTRRTLQDHNIMSTPSSTT